jgi:hypothetical protein
MSVTTTLLLKAWMARLVLAGGERPRSNRFMTGGY